MRLVPIECVKDGCFLGKTIYDDQGRPLLRSGVTLTTNLIKKIKDIHIYSIYIKDEYSEHELEDIIKPQLRQKCITLVKDLFKNVQSKNIQIHNAYISTKNFNSILRERDDYLLSLSNLAEELITNILSNTNILINLVDIKNLDNYLYQHSVNVAILSIVLGIGLKLNKTDLLNLCVGAFLHDIGKIFIPTNIRNTHDKTLIKNEIELMKEHTKRGYDYVKNAFYIPAPAKFIILQHHERINGLGYPNGLTSDKINKLSKIVSVADAYDKLTSNNLYNKALYPNEAFEYILAGASTLFDYDVVKVFSKLIVPFNEDTIIKLNNGDIGIVVESNSSYPLRPVIKIIKSKDKDSINSIIDLSKKLSLVVQSIEYEVK